jgi:hypothetical protein
MKDTMQKRGKLPVGFTIIRYVYVLAALISAFSAVLLNPYTNVIVCGKEMGSLPSIIINSILVLFPLILYFGFLRPTVTIWYLAFIYHIFFIGNTFLSLIPLLFPKSVVAPILQITGKSSLVAQSLNESLFMKYLNLFYAFNITTLLGIFIVWYLWQKRSYFMPKPFLKKI